MTTRSSLYAGRVYHRRVRPREHKLSYSVFTLLLDLSEIDELAKRLWLFSHNRFNLFGFYDRDFGENQSEKLMDYIARQLAESGINTSPARVLLSCYPRVLGYVFNPLSLFYCLDENDRCFAVMHEVHNTFGERHAYVLPVDDQNAVPGTPEDLENVIANRDVNRGVNRDVNRGVNRDVNRDVKPVQWISQQADKELFVSPFAHMGMTYQFRFNMPAQQQLVVIKASDSEGLLITASYKAARHDLSAARLTRFFFTIPFLSLKVVLGIHWEALRLWLKGVPMFKHQPKRPT